MRVGWTVVCGRRRGWICPFASRFAPATLAKYDVLFLSNSTLRAAQPDDTVERAEPRNHDNPAPALTKAQEQAMLDFVRSGKGLVVTHSGVDAFYGSRGYREMIGGGLFESHPWTRHVRLNVEDRGNAAVVRPRASVHWGTP